MNGQLRGHEPEKGFFGEIYHRLFSTETLNEDVVSNASSLLDIGEFQLFQLAHTEWYGEEGDVTFIERCYLSYLFEENIPHWVRHFARTIIALDRENRLEPLSGEYHRYDNFGVTPSPRSSRISTAIGVLLFLISVIAFTMFIIYSSIRFPGTL